MEDGYLEEQKEFLAHAYLDAYGLTNILKTHPIYNNLLHKKCDEIIELLEVGEGIIALAEGQPVDSELVAKIRAIYPSEEYSGTL